MKASRLILLFGVVAIIISSCNNQVNQKEKQGLNLTDSINHYEKLLFSNNSEKIKPQDAIKLADFYQSYALENEDDSITPFYLFKSADINMNMRRPQAAINSFDIILSKYPDFEKVPSALFLKAFIYEDQLKDLENASKYYKLFIEKYPDSDFADDAAISLQYLGKTPEELIEEFEKNN